MRLGLWILPLRMLRRLQGRAARPSDRVSASRPSRARIVWAITQARRIVPRATCLPQALATHTLLARNGYAAELRLGVARDERGALEAHAWVECDDQVVIGNLRDLARYVPLPPFPGKTA